MFELKGEANPEVGFVCIEVLERLAVSLPVLGKYGRQECTLLAQPVRQVELKIVVLECVGRINRSGNIQAVVKSPVSSPDLAESPPLEIVWKAGDMLIVAVPELGTQFELLYRRIDCTCVCGVDASGIVVYVTV